MRTLKPQGFVDRAGLNGQLLPRDELFGGGDGPVIGADASHGPGPLEQQSGAPGGSRQLFGDIRAMANHIGHSSAPHRQGEEEE